MCAENATPADALTGAEVAALQRADAYPLDADAGGGIRMVQTHISWVFLTETRVYKFRKPTRMGSFLDFTSRAKRTADCVRELELNRRLAPDVYLGIAPAVASSIGLRIGAAGESPLADHEHCVVMRRLRDGCDALSLLQRGELSAADLERLAKRLSEFHRRVSLGRPAPWSAPRWRKRFSLPAEENFRILGTMSEELAPRATLERAEGAARSFLARHAADVERRRKDGRAVDGHGDLHLAHVWYEHPGGDPLVVDCLEFSDELRRIDGAADVAFLAMDLLYRGRRDLAERFLAAYAEACGDFHLYSVVDYHVAYRAGVRAKVAALTACDPNVDTGQREGAAGSARRHLELAATVLSERARPALVLLCGVVGTGKSSVARALADTLGAPCISSDRLREVALASVARAKRYTAARRARVYRELLAAAACVLGSGRTAVLDATFETVAARAEASSLAAATGATAWLVHVEAETAVVLARLGARAATGHDPSDAGPEQYTASVQRFEPPREWPARNLLTLRTDAGDWTPEIEGFTQRIRGANDAAGS
jgi:hypothetical protein